jgi:hypothetical protein
VIEEIKIDESLIALNQDDVKNSAKIIKQCLLAGAHISLWHLVETNTFRCEIWDEERSLKFRVDSKSWGEALAAVTKGFYQDLKEDQQ